MKAVLFALLFSGVVLADELPAPAAGANSQLKYSVYGFLGTSENIPFRNVNYSGNGKYGAGTAEFNFDKSMGVGVEVRDARPNDFGWAAGITYDTRRSLNSSKVVLNGGSSTEVFTSSKPTLSFFTGYLNAIYSWEKPYLLFGVNYSFPSFEQGPLLGTTSVVGGIDAQAGVGVHFTEHIAIEAIYRSVNFKATRSAEGFNYDMGSAYLGGFQTNVKYTF